MNAFLDRQKRRIGQVGRTAESNLAKRLNGLQTPASGGANAKGDVILGDVLLEAKSTTAGSMVLKLDWLLKIAQEAMMTGRVPALAVTFTDPAGKPLKDGGWVMIPESDFKAISERLTE